MWCWGSFDGDTTTIITKAKCIGILYMHNLSLPISQFANSCKFNPVPPFMKAIMLYDAHLKLRHATNRIVAGQAHDTTRPMQRQRWSLPNEIGPKGIPRSEYLDWCYANNAKQGADTSLPKLIALVRWNTLFRKLQWGNNGVCNMRIENENISWHDLSEGNNLSPVESGLFVLAGVTRSGFGEDFLTVCLSVGYRWRIFSPLTPDTSNYDKMLDNSPTTMGWLLYRIRWALLGGGLY